MDNAEYLRVLNEKPKFFSKKAAILTASGIILSAVLFIAGFFIIINDI